MEKTKSNYSSLKASNNKKILEVTPSQHAAWHKENGSCGRGKEHTECIKKNSIVIKRAAKKEKK